MVRAEDIVKASVFEAICGGTELSVTLTIMLKVPALAGVPENTPARLKFIPSGSPLAIQR
jgi:hypothetical protein